MSSTTAPEEILFHAEQWLDEYRAAKPSKRALLGYCENAALVIEIRAYEALIAQGIRPMDDSTGADPDANRLAWLNEAMHSRDFCPLGSAEYLAFTAILCGADMRDAIDSGDAELAALSMMGIVASALAAGFAIVETEADIARRSREGASEGGKARAKLFNTDRARVRELASSMWQEHPDWSDRRVAKAITKRTRIAFNSSYGFVRALKKEASPSAPSPETKKI